ncbi:MAG: efflux RND transporter periplasmic adaptor subunit [Patescibacteria group bacterium]|nr:efflux RND transporter periplasmic adaptor subunit [Patescibacteria group bacterium]
MASILEESKKAKGNGIFNFWKNKKIMIPLVAVAVIALPLYYFLNKEEEQKQTSAPKEWTIKKANIIISTESDGKVMAEDGVELSFNVSDDNLAVKEVYVKEGADVKKGDKIALAETKSLELSLSSVWSAYQSALADYNETMDGSTDKEVADANDRISSAEISLEQSHISLANIEQSAANSIYDAEQDLKDAKDELDDNKDELSSEDVSDAYEALVDNIKATNIALGTNLVDSDEIIGVDKEYLNDDFEKSLGAKDLNSITSAKRSYASARDELESLNSLALALSIKSVYSEIDIAAVQAEIALNAFEEHFYDMKVLLDNTGASSNLTQAELDAFIATIASARSSINTKITLLNTKLGAVENAKDGLEDYIDDYDEAVRDLANAKADALRDIKNAEASLSSKELSLEQAKRDYNDLIAPLTDAEIALARSRLTSASVTLTEAQNDLDEATIISPIDGQVVELNYKVGDIIVDNDDPVAVILNSETLFIEVNIEEADVSDLKLGQKATATFDALDELKLSGEVSFISLTSETNNNGIVTYKVRVAIENPDEQQIREGMTTYIDFISGGVENVLVAPVSAVRNVDGKPSAQLVTGEWVPVVTGFTDGKNVEIISGVGVGDKILY